MALLIENQCLKELLPWVEQKMWLVICVRNYTTLFSDEPKTMVSIHDNEVDLLTALSLTSGKNTARKGEN